jgi:hypothetical protein
MFFNRETAGTAVDTEHGRGSERKSIDCNFLGYVDT